MQAPSAASGIGRSRSSTDIAPAAAAHGTGTTNWSSEDSAIARQLALVNLVHESSAHTQTSLARVSRVAEVAAGLAAVGNGVGAARMALRGMHAATAVRAGHAAACLAVAWSADSARRHCLAQADEARTRANVVAGIAQQHVRGTPASDLPPAAP